MTKAELYKKACMLPLLPGVYIIRDKTDTIIYIGKAKRLRIRVSQYFREGVPHDNKVSQMIAHAYAFDVIVCQSEFEALVLEASQIKANTPKYNILLKDDKGYSYIKITKEEWPRLSFVLQKEDDGAEYLGPYTSSFAARQMAETAMDAFLLPRCNKRFPQEGTISSIRSAAPPPASMSPPAPASSPTTTGWCAPSSCAWRGGSSGTTTPAATPCGRRWSAPKA